MFFGAHVSTSGGIDKSVQRALDIGADAAQIFTQSPRAWRPTAHKSDAIDRFREQKEKHLQGAVAHAIYLINVASDNPDLWEKSTTALTQTMEIAAQLGLDAVIFHPGSHKGDVHKVDEAIERIAKACLKALSTTEDNTEGKTPWLLLENSAGQGGTIGKSVEELASLINAADEHPRLGVCLDSCHWWVSGVDVTSPTVLNEQISNLDQAIGIDRLKAIHLNDAKADLGSNLDRHENIGDGMMGSGLKNFLGHELFQDLGVYLEVPGDGNGPRAEDIEAARNLIK